MGVYIKTWNSITKAQVEADENLNVIYEVDDDTKIRAIELKDNKDSFAVWVGDDRCNLFRLNQSDWIPLFNYLFHKYGVWYCFEDDVEDLLYEEDAYIRSAMYHKAYVEFVDSSVDYYTDEEKQKRQKMVDWYQGIFIMIDTKNAIEFAFEIDSLLDDIYSDEKVKEEDFKRLKEETLPYLKSDEDPIIFNAMRKKMIDGIELMVEKINEGEIKIIK